MSNLVIQALRHDVLFICNLPSGLFLCTLTHGCSWAPILLHFKLFMLYYFNIINLSIMFLFTLQIYTIISV